MKEEKKVSFPVTPQEHERIKQLAQKERRTIKLLFFNALDKLYPGWDREEKKAAPSRTAIPLEA